MKNNNQKKEISSLTFQDHIVEQIHDPLLEPSNQFAVYSCIEKNITTQPSVCSEDGIEYIPIQSSSLIDSKVVLLPSEATDYGTEEMLVAEIKEFIHKYLDVHPFHETITVHYILMTWVFDRLSVVPYLRALGDYGVGKTRFIQTIGSLCYKPMFLAGATSDAFLFRVIELFGGTLVINEMERVNTDMKSQITVILNNGYEKGMSIGRVEGEKKREPKTFNVFCPKLFSIRKRFKDLALESRIITVPMRQTARKDIPITISEIFWKDSLKLRNKLLKYRFDHLNDVASIEFLEKEHKNKLDELEPRLRQTLLPLVLVMTEKRVIDRFLDYASDFQKQLVTDRGLELNALVFEKLYELDKKNEGVVTVKDVTNLAQKDIENERIKLTSQKVGKIIRDDLGFKTKKGTGGLYHVIVTEHTMNYLIDRYGIESPSSPQTPPIGLGSNEDSVDLVDLL